MFYRGVAAVLLTALSYLPASGLGIYEAQSGRPAKAARRAARPVDILVGSPAVMRDERSAANKDKLSDMSNDAMVRRFVKGGYLVAVPDVGRSYYIDTGEVREKFRYLRPWSRLLVERFSDQYKAKFKKTFKITSAVRTIPYQAVLRRQSLTAAPATGNRASTHMTGATFDVSKSGMRPAELAWMDDSLSSLERSGVVKSTRENAAYHIFVGRAYADYVAEKVSRSYVDDVFEQYARETELAGNNMPEIFVSTNR